MSRLNKLFNNTRFLYGLCICVISWQAAAEDLRNFANEDQRLRYKQLTEELRCLVCQNQNLADSDAGLANDLRDELYAMITNDKSDDEIIAFMAERYGDFVFYQPPIKISTVLLWFGPFVLLSLTTLFLVLFLLKRSDQANNLPLSQKEQQRLQTLLNKDEPR